MSGRIWVGLRLAFVALLLIGCEDESASVPALGAAPVTTTGSERPAIVPGTAQWEFRELGRIGGLDSPPHQEFSSRLMSIELGPHGTIYTLDQQLGLIRSYDRSGELLSEFGGLGDGPGELRAPAGLTFVSPNRLLVPNGFNGRYTVFDSTGALIETLRREPRRLFKLQLRNPGITDSTFLDHLSLRSDGRPRIALIEVAWDGTVLDTASILTVPEPRRGSTGPLRPGSAWRDALIRFGRKTIYEIGDDGSQWMVDEVGDRLLRLSVTGDTLVDVDLASHQIPPTRAESNLIAAALREARLDEDEVDLSRQLVYTLIPGPRDGILLSLNGEMGEPTDAAEWFSRDGSSLGRVHLGFKPALTAIMDSSADTVFAVAVGDLDVPYLIWGIIEPTGDTENE